VSIDALDPLLHQPLRTQIAAYLAGAGQATFSDLKRLIGVSDGNLDAHLKKLLAADYVQAHKITDGPRPQTVYSLTTTGREALLAYVAALQGLIAFAQVEPTRLQETVNAAAQPAHGVT